MCVQYFTAMDRNAEWARGLRSFVDQYIAFGQFDLAQEAQEHLDDAQEQDLVHQVMQVRPCCLRGCAAGNALTGSTLLEDRQPLQTPLCHAK